MENLLIIYLHDKNFFNRIDFIIEFCLHRIFIVCVSPSWKFIERKEFLEIFDWDKVWVHFWHQHDVLGKTFTHTPLGEKARRVFLLCTLTKNFGHKKSFLNTFSTFIFIFTSHHNFVSSTYIFKIPHFFKSSNLINIISALSTFFSHFLSLQLLSFSKFSRFNSSKAGLLLKMFSLWPICWLLIYSSIVTYVITIIILNICSHSCCCDNSRIQPYFLYDISYIVEYSLNQRSQIL